MNQSNFLLLLLLFSNYLFAQNEGNIWILSNKTNTGDSLRFASIIDFNVNPPFIYPKETGIGARGANASYAHPETGELLLFTDAIHIYNDNFDIIENGEEFLNSSWWPSGWGGVQGSIFLPKPGAENVISYIGGKDIYWWYQN